jgi:hypothetical protein
MTGTLGQETQTEFGVKTFHLYKSKDSVCATKIHAALAS